MAVDAKTVRRIAHLARIAVADDEVEHLQGELNAILQFVEQLSATRIGQGFEDCIHQSPLCNHMVACQARHFSYIGS